jgi:hypothetical protein
MTQQPLLFVVMAACLSPSQTRLPDENRQDAGRSLGKLCCRRLSFEEHATWASVTWASDDGTRIWQPASRPSTAGPVSTGRRVSGNTRMRWRRHRQALMIRRIAATGATTDTHDHSIASPQYAAR